MSQPWSHRSVLLVGLLLGMGGSLAASSAPVSPVTHRGAKRPLRIRVPDRAGMSVRRALLAARERLSAPGCRSLLDEFRSVHASRPLTDVLADLGRTPEQHLDTLRFEDGSRHPRCASPAVLAFTRPGSDSVSVCASQFQRAVRTNPAYAEMILIHEWLHTLGLGENPPTSLEITARVTERCGEAAARRVQASR